MEGKCDSKPGRVAIEDVVQALSSQCDGARKRDGRGFSRADAQEGGRLSAMLRRGLAWSVADARKAMEIAQRYPQQAGTLLSDGREAKATGIATALRKGVVALRNEPVADQKPYNYVGFSPGGRYVYFWNLAQIDDLSSLGKQLRAIGQLRHGVRRIFCQRFERADLTINGEKRRASRLTIDFNGTSQPHIIKVAQEFGFLVEPAIEEVVDAEVDLLRQNERAVWLHEGTRDGKRGQWAVFDLALKHEPFSAAVKKYLRGRYDCRPDDDWNWYVVWDVDTANLIGQIARHFNFAASPAIEAGFKDPGKDRRRPLNPSR